MSRRNKLIKFTENLTFPNVYECMEFGNPLLKAKNGDQIAMKGVWKSKHFNNDKPLTLELACGRGEYSLALSERYPERNFIGVDIKGARIWRGAKNALDMGLQNVAFLRARIESITSQFSQDEIDEIWITFPDPFLRDSKANRRLTAPPFLERYRHFLKPGGKINLKTDSPELYAFTLEVIEQEKHKIQIQSNDIYKDALPHPDLDIKTYYEKKHLEDNRIIKFVQFTIS